MTKYVFKSSKNDKGFRVIRTHKVDCLTSAIDVYLLQKLGYPFVLHDLSQNKGGTYLARTTDRDYNRSCDIRFSVKEINA